MPPASRHSEREQYLFNLDLFYVEVKKLILDKQHPISGLLPASTAVTSHGNYTDAWVRDNVYSILCVWGLGLAYKKIDDEMGRAHELEHATVKCMRGLLMAMMKQAHKVEEFKTKPSPLNCLHAKYNTATGETVVADDGWGHLQLDATSIFLLYLAQMTASGLKIIYTYDEVDFVQNLVYYIEESYMTPDYGIWERGNKSNHGQAELNASSVGMAKAALEAMSNMNLFGKHGTPDSVIHSSADEIARCEATLNALLPRESASKECDSACLSIIGFPAFAIHDASIVEDTRQTIIKKLGGKYGFKRFLRDGHQCANEASDRLHYEPWELKQFIDVECEWPLFFTYMVLDGLFYDNTEQTNEYMTKMENCLVKIDDIDYVPELFWVPLENIPAEQEEPNSQKRLPNENIPLVWAQSLYVLGRLLRGKYLHKEDIDPLQRWRLVGKIAREPIVQVLVVAEDDSVKDELAEAGIISETPDDLFPAVVSPPRDLGLFYQQLGANEKLHLTGRPTRRIRSLATSRVYLMGDKYHMFTSTIHNTLDSYLPVDYHFFVASVGTELAFLQKHFSAQGRPTITLLITRSILDKGRTAILGMMRRLNEGVYNNVKVKVGHFQDLLLTASVRRVAHAPEVLNMPRSFSVLGLRKYYLPNKGDEGGPGGSPVGYPLKRVNTATRGLVEMLQTTDDLEEQVDVLRKLIPQHGLDFNTEFDSGSSYVITLRDIAQEVYEKAAKVQDWSKLRFAAALMEQSIPELPDRTMDLLIRQFNIMIGGGADDKDTVVITNQRTTADNFLSQVKFAVSRLKALGDEAQAHLAAEVLVFLSSIAQEFPDFFTGITNLSIGAILDAAAACPIHPADVEGVPADFDCTPVALRSEAANARRLQLMNWSPFAMKTVLEALLGLTEDNIHAQRVSWGIYRQVQGALFRVPNEFHPALWRLLDHSENGGAVAGSVVESSVPSHPTVLEMTAEEKNFELRVYEFLKPIHAVAPDFMILAVEVVMAMVVGADEHEAQGGEAGDNSGWVIREWINFSVVLNCIADVYVAGSNGKVQPHPDAAARWRCLCEVPTKVLRGLVQSCFSPNSTGAGGADNQYTKDRPSFLLPWGDAVDRWSRSSAALAQ